MNQDVDSAAADKDQTMLRAIVEDEQGRAIGEGVDLSANMLPAEDETEFVCLRFVDPYGDTVFNRMQIPVVMEELRLIRETISEPDQQRAIEHLQKYCARCVKEPHLYLRFIGD